MARAFQGSILADHKQFVVGIVNASVHRLRDYEDILADLPQGRRPTELSESDRKQVRIVSAKKQACCSVLRAFSELDSSLLRSHCQSLAPIIKGMLDGVISHSDLGCVDCVLHILELAVGAHGDWDVEFLEELMRDVEHIVCTSPVQIVEEAAVRCLCVVTHKSASAEASESLERTTRNFMSFLNSEKDAIEESARVAITATQSTNLQEYVQLADIPRLSPLEKNSRCALVRLGLLIRFGDFAEELVSEAYDTIESICDMLCTSFPSHTLARSSVRALTHVLIRHRSLLAKGTRVLVSALENSNLSAPANGNFSSSGDGLALCVLEGFRELLRDEEERNSRSKIIKEEQKKTSTKAANRKGEKPKCAVSAEQESTAIREDVQQPQLGAEEDAEAGYLALSAQTMIARLETAVHSAARPVRQVVAHILGLLVRQGLVLPATVIPSLFCLLLDGDPSCREFSYRVISFLADRHSDMLASAALPGLRRCFESSFAVRYGRPPLVKESEVPGESLYTVERILKMAADEKSGQSLLSQAIMSMRKDKRRGVLESLIREFDPRISVRKKSSKRTKNEVFAVHRENGLFEASTLDTEVAPHAISEVDDKDDDVIPAETGEIDITISGRLCSIPTLYFFAATMASIDYTDGAGVGGSLTQGGGTAAADSKLKYAKEEVSHLVGVATRIISNSGQATLHAAGYVRRREYQNGHAASLEKRDLVLQSAARISLLLLLKKHLKVTRFMPVVDTVETDSIAQGPYGMPPFHPVGAMHQAFVDANRAGYDSAQADALFNLFSTLMREDAIDEADVTLASRVGRGARGSAKRAVTKRVRSKHGERGNSEPRRKRPGRQAAQDASRKFRVDLDESE
ncbi:unnamed protein product [Chondrus crispus]|uniref:Sister chromatid cohesion protein n=1 Tax=Chondrus crispus TaxID=2769 RepID=R7QQJ9_CHOCR|nr:unnamed protein product [Chondrus crispus]CDF39998.1 unnamed protein product [Chondrus crispus]|eukprot:XP_005710292.1 unnamed protein product [Chondrus crispus]